MSAQPQQIITAAEARAVEVERRSVKARIGERYGIDPEILMGTLRSTVFKGDVSTEQLIMLLVVADQHKLNPFTKEIYAFPSQQGIVPVVGVDGWARIINEHPQFDGMDFEQTDESCTCRMYRKDRSHPTVVTEYMAECKRGTGPWGTHPKRMLRHKAMIQAARLAFSFAGIYDPDEAEAIVENEINVTPPKPILTVDETGKPSFRNPDGSEYVKPQKLGPKRLREVIEGLIKHSENNNGPELLKIRRALSNDEWLHAYGELRSWEASAVRKALADAEKADQGIGLDTISIEALRRCTNAAELEEAWINVQNAYADNDAEPPDSVVVACDEMRSSMGV